MGLRHFNVLDFHIALVNIIGHFIGSHFTVEAGEVEQCELRAAVRSLGQWPIDGDIVLSVVCCYPHIAVAGIHQIQILQFIVASPLTGEGNIFISILNGTIQHLIRLFLQQLCVGRLSGINVVVDDIVKQQLNGRSVHHFHRIIIDVIGSIIWCYNTGFFSLNVHFRLYYIAVLYLACGAAHLELCGAGSDLIRVPVVLQRNISMVDAVTVDLHGQVLIQMIGNDKVVFSNNGTVRLDKLHPDGCCAAFVSGLKAVDAVGCVFIVIIRDDVPLSYIILICVFQRRFGGVEVVHTLRR